MLGARAGLTIADVDRALYTDRTLVKQLAMRRTLFVFPRELLPAVLPSSSARVAGAERARMAKDIESAGVAEDGPGWLDRARAAILAVLQNAPGGLTAQEIRLAVPTIDVRVEPPAGDGWGASRVITNLGLTGDIMRAENTGHWRTARPRWMLTRNWLGANIVQGETADGYTEIVRRWLHSFGPGTEADLVWWLGSTKSIVRTALAAVGAVEVSLDGDETGWLLPDDLEVVKDPGRWVALLPVLDPTVMGWKSRDFYLGPHSERLFEARGNAGTTAWVNGRIVGCWIQDAAGDVRVALVEDVPDEDRLALDAEAARLSSWLGGERVGTPYTSPAMKDALLG